MKLTLECIILYAIEVSGDKDKEAVLRLFGLALGFWVVNIPEQSRVFIAVVQEIIKSNSLPNIRKIEFDWFAAYHAKEVNDNDNHLIKLESNHKAIVASVDAEELLVAVYATDSNSLCFNYSFKMS